ncbi:MAG: hypothetical protein ACI9VR_000715 [Cognaticolwellia sp.]|jgi:hypothetical protein
MFETKTRIGAKHIGGHGDLVAEEVYRGYQSGIAPSCEWGDVSYGYEYAVVLGKHWGMSVSDTKSTIVSKIRMGDRPYLQQELGAALRPLTGTPSWTLHASYTWESLDLARGRVGHLETPQ